MLSVFIVIDCNLGLAIDGGQGKDQSAITILKKKGKVAALQQEISGMALPYNN